MNTEVGVSWPGNERRKYELWRIVVYGRIKEEEETQEGEEPLS